MKFKKGQKVRVRKDLEVGKEYGDCDFASDMSKYRGKVAKITRVGLCFHDLDIDGGEYYWSDEMLKPAKKTLDNLEVGDVLVDDEGDERMVLGICDRVYFLSDINDFDIARGWYTLKEIKGKYTLKDSEPEEDDKTEEAIELLKSKGYKIVKK